MSAQQGEAATIAMVSAARQIFEAVRAGEPDSSARIQTLHGTYEQQWSLLRAAAAALESPAPAVGAGAADAADHEALSEERQDALAVWPTEVHKQRRGAEAADLFDIDASDSPGETRARAFPACSGNGGEGKICWRACSCARRLVVSMHSSRGRQVPHVWLPRACALV